MSQAEAFAPAQKSMDSHHSFQRGVDGHQLMHPGFLVSGAVLAVGIAFGHWFLPEQLILESLGVLGGALGGVYIGMGVVSPEPKKVALQLGMGTVILGLAFAGLWASPVFFALMCFAHAAWDVVTGHPKCLNFSLVNWYVPMCLGYDILFGVFILGWWVVL